MAKGVLRVRITGDDRDLQRKLKTAGSAMGKFAAVGVAAVAGAAAFSVKKFADFDQAMTESLAIMGDVSEEMRGNMSDAAREVAKTTKFSADQAAESYFFLASAGLDAEAAIAALPQVAKFAQAGNFDMALATDLATDAQSALGLASDDAAENLENLTRVTDVFVKANTLANTSVEQISEAMTNKAGAAMRAVGMEIEEGSAVLAAFADQGVKGAEAGTQFAIVLRDLQTKAISNAEDFKEFGVSVFDADGEMRNMASIVGDLEGALADMSDEQKKATLAQLGFSDKSMGSLQTLLGTSEAIREYETELRSAGGITDEVANKQMQTFWAQLGLLKDQFIDVAINVGQKLMPHLMKFVGWLQDNQPAIEAFVDNALQLIGDVITKVVIPAFKTIKGVIEAVVGWFKGGENDVIASTAGLRDFIAEAWTTIQGIVQSATKLVMAVLNVLQGFWKRHGETISGFVSRTWKHIQTVIQAALKIIKGVFDFFAAVFRGDWKGMWNAVVDIAKNLWTIIQSTIGHALDTIVTLLKTVGKDLLNLAINIGKDIVKGIWEGIKGLGSWLKDKVTGFIGNAVGAVGNFLGISSPSKLMADEIGAPMSQGILEGLMRHADDLANAQVQMVAPKFDTTRGESSGPRVAFGDINVSGANITARDVIDEAAWRFRTSGV